MESAPPHWKDDLFIVNNSPLSLQIRYGQDERFGQPHTLNEDAASWGLERNTHYCRTMWIALATHLWYRHSFLLHPYFYRS